MYLEIDVDVKRDINTGADTDSYDAATDAGTYYKELRIHFQRLTSPQARGRRAGDPGLAMGSSRPKVCRLQTPGELMSQFKSKGREKPMS